MSAPKMKNLVILILLLVNAFLLALVIPKQMEARRLKEQAVNALVQMYDEAGVTLAADRICDDTPPAPVEFSLEEIDGIAAAQTLLGENILTQTVGTEKRYTGPRGTAVLTARGVFTARLTASSPTEDAEAEVRRLCTALGIPYSALHSRTVGSAVQYTAVMTVQGKPVLTGGFVFRYEEGVLTSASGSLVPLAHPRPLARPASASCRDALVAFLASRLETGWMGSRIESVTLGYAQTVDAAQKTATMHSAWQISTDAGEYLVDCATRTVTAQ